MGGASGSWIRGEGVTEGGGEGAGGDRGVDGGLGVEPVIDISKVNEERERERRHRGMETAGGRGELREMGRRGVGVGGWGAEGKEKGGIRDRERN